MNVYKRIKYHYRKARVKIRFGKKKERHDDPEHQRPYDKARRALVDGYGLTWKKATKKLEEVIKQGIDPEYDLFDINEFDYDVYRYLYP